MNYQKILLPVTFSLDLSGIVHPAATGRIKATNTDGSIREYGAGNTTSPTGFNGVCVALANHR
ncbi:MAG: hypothetical protein Q7J74_12460 [Pseudomonas sp.]|nr:hypothetical protein [Pseudomonas sp.]